jgi:hypothetical protein
LRRIPITARWRQDTAVIERLGNAVQARYAGRLSLGSSGRQLPLSRRLDTSDASI